MALPAGASSISVTVRVRPFTIREAAQMYVYLLNSFPSWEAFLGVFWLS
jgi:hypothetical protein